MALDSYSALKTAISSFLGDTAQDANRDDFIALAETYFNRRLRHTEMEEQSTVVTDSDGLADLSTDIMAIRSARFLGSPNVELKPISKGGENRLSPDDTAGANPFWYSITTIDGVKKLRITPILDGASIVLTTLNKLTPLSTNNTSNWLLVLAPDAYLYRSLFEAYTWRQSPDKALALLQRAELACEEITTRDELARYMNAELVFDGFAP